MILLFSTNGFAKLQMPDVDELAGISVISGKKVQLKIKNVSYPTVIVFLSARCPCSAAHEQILKKLYFKYNSEKTKVQFVGIHSNATESFEMTQKHFQAGSFPFEVIQDNNSVYANLFKALKTPHAFVTNGKDDLIFAGGVDDSRNAIDPKKHYLDDAIEAALNNRMPEIQEAKSLGCFIERE